jgi:hypothetical protein
MLNSKFKFFTIFFMLSTAFVLSTGCKKGEAICKGLWDKFHECTSEKDKKKLEGLLGTKEDFMKRCEGVKDDESVKNFIKVIAAEDCDKFKNIFKNKDNKEAIWKLTTLGEIMKGIKEDDASCKGLWDKFNECSSSKEKKQIKGLLGAKDEFMKRCEGVEDDESVENIMKAAVEDCDKFKNSFKDNKEAMIKLTTLGEKMKKMKEKKEEKK